MATCPGEAGAGGAMIISAIEWLLRRAVRVPAPVPPPSAPSATAAERLLMVAYYFPPENSIGALRPERLRKYLSRLGAEVAVVARFMPELPPPPPFVTRVPPPGPPRRASVVLQRLQAWFLPYDDRLPWVPDALAAAEAGLAAQPGQVVFTTHPPVATHLVGLVLKLRHGVPWIADFRDPLVGNPLRSGARGAVIDTVMEQLIFRNADAVIANTDRVREAWQRRHPAQAGKIHLLWNGFDPEDGLAAKPVSPRARRHIAHIGTIYGGRTPGPLIAALARLIAAGRIAPDALQLRLLGPIENAALADVADDVAALAARDCIRIDDRRAPREEANAEMLDADFLLLLDMTNDRHESLQLPAKMFDYVRACRPILAFTRPGSVIRSVMAECAIPGTCIDPAAPPAEIDAAVADFLAIPPADVPVSAGFTAKFNAEDQARTLAALIRAVRIASVQ